MPNEQIYRLFIAVKIPDSVKRSALDHLTLTAEARSVLRMVRPENMHLTLAFIGEAPAPTADSIAEGLREALPKQPPIVMTVDTYGAFPNARSPRVVWAGASEPPAAIFQLQKKVAEVLDRRQIAYDRKKFSPHLTIGRIKTYGRAPDLSDMLAAASIPQPRPFALEQVILYRSELLPQGPRYTELATVRFVD